MIVYLYLCLVAKSCNCGGTKNFAILSSYDLGQLKGKIAYSDYLHQRYEVLVLDIQDFSLDTLRRTMFVDYNHPGVSFLDSNSNAIFSTQLNTLPSVRNGRYQCTHK